MKFVEVISVLLATQSLHTQCPLMCSTH